VPEPHRHHTEADAHLLHGGRRLLLLQRLQLVRRERGEGQADQLMRHQVVLRLAWPAALRLRNEQLLPLLQARAWSVVACRNHTRVEQFVTGFRSDVHRECGLCSAACQGMLSRVLLSRVLVGRHAASFMAIAHA